MKNFITFIALSYIGIMFFSCSQKSPLGTDTSEISFNITYENIKDIEAKVVNSARVYISGTNDFYREVVLTVSGGYATGSTELEYGTYCFRVEMFEDNILK
ncbi:MAG: hypothetical protein L6407_07660, partial [Candidatus Delongbacteria bacterium]|nr:hypothetical protein [Candidatus Delongbacteria bacterium]